MINDKPLLMSADMVTASLNGIKTNTRRVANPQPIANHRLDEPGTFRILKGKKVFCFDNEEDLRHYMPLDHCPYGQIGDYLWIRETWNLIDVWGGSPWPRGGKLPGDAPVGYKLIFAEQTLSSESWRPSIHMPRWASRITLKITDIRFEQLQDITEQYCIDEGIGRLPLAAMSMDHKLGYRDYLTPERETINCYKFDPRQSFISLWNSINQKRGHSWPTNPWVWVIKFDVINKNIDHVIT